MESAMPTVVLVHGAWNGPWVWDEVRRYLDLARIASAAVTLPSVGENTGKGGAGWRADQASPSAAGDIIAVAMPGSRPLADEVPVTVGGNPGHE
jgi:hypothetical protein